VNSEQADEIIQDDSEGRQGFIGSCETNLVEIS